MSSVGTLGGTLPWGPKSLKVNCQDFPHDGSTELKQPTPASSPGTDTITGLEPRVQQDVAGRSKKFLVDTGAPTLSWSPTPEPSPPKSVPFCMPQEKQVLKDSPKHLFVAGMDKYFSTSFSWSLNVLLSYREEFSLHLKSCTYCSPDRRGIKTLFLGKTKSLY